MNKIKVEKSVFYKTQDNYIKWKNIKHIEFEDDDIIKAEFVEPYHSENNSHDGYFVCEIIRLVEETDAQFKKRKEKYEKMISESKKKRYESYLKLKEEFENK
jgi:hypothetical protein